MAMRLPMRRMPRTVRPSDARYRRIDRAQQKHAGQADALKRLPDDSRFERGDIGRDVWQLGHTNSLPRRWQSTGNRFSVSLLQNRVVDQPRATQRMRQRRRACRARRFRPARAWPNRQARCNRCALQARRQRSCARIAMSASARRSPAATSASTWRTARLRDERLRALGGAEIDVARAERQPVGSRTMGQTTISVAEPQVGHHAPQHGHLCSILLAEEGAVGLRGDQQLGNHRGHAAKVPGPGCAIETARSGLDLDKRRRARWIKLFDRGREDHIRAFGLGQRAIGLEGARIAGVILVGSELRGVDEDADGDVADTRRCAARISEACPACSAPMVGTRPMVLPPSLRSARDHWRSSATVRRISIRPFRSALPVFAAVASRALARRLRAGDSSPRRRERRGARRLRDSVRWPSGSARPHRHSGAQIWPPAQRSGSADRGRPESGRRNPGPAPMPMVGMGSSAVMLRGHLARNAFKHDCSCSGIGQRAAHRP